MRCRVLDDHELAAVWKAADETPYPIGPYIKLLLLTGARKSEASDAAWSEFDLDSGLWVVPQERFKSGVTHRVPLSKDAVALLNDLPRWDRSSLVFSFDGKRPMNGHSKSKGRVDAAVNDLLGQPVPLANPRPEKNSYTRWAGVSRVLAVIDNGPFLPPAEAHAPLVINYPAYHLHRPKTHTHSVAKPVWVACNLLFRHQTSLNAEAHAHVGACTTTLAKWPAQLRLPRSISRRPGGGKPLNAREGVCASVFF